MDRKRILIVSASFYPQVSPRSFRTTELAKELVRQGHKVVVYVPFREFDYSTFSEEIHTIEETKIIIKDIGPLRFKSIELKGNRIGVLIRRGFRRILGLLLEYPNIELMFKVAKRLKHEIGYDLLISVAVPYPIHWGVAKARTKNHKIADIWVADCGDPYMGCETDSFKKPFYFKFVEKWFSRKCDYISIPFEALKGKFYPEFHEKIIVIPQGFKVEDIILAEKVENPVPTFAFAGLTIPGIRDLSLFFEFLKKINHAFKFHIYTKQPNHFKKYKEHFKERLEIHEYLPRLQLLYELSKCDFLVNVDTIYDCQSVSTAFPSKLIDYSFTGRPILNVCSNALNENIVYEFLSGNYFNKRELDSREYKIETVTSKFLDLSQRNSSQAIEDISNGFKGRKKILIVSASFHPQNSPRSFRTTELAKEFARQGHSVTVFTRKNTNIEIFEKEHNLVVKDLGKQKWKSITIKGKGIDRLLRRLLSRFLKLFLEYPYIELYWDVKKVLKNESGYDIMISIAVPYPVHWGVAASRSKDHSISKIWVADCGDPFMGQENDSFKVPFYFSYVEKWFMRKADYISVPTIGAINAYYPEFHPKIKVIPQGFRFEDYNFDNKEVNNTKPTFAYAGMFIPKRRDPSELLNFLMRLDTDYEFHIYTSTPHLIPKISGKSIGKIIIHDPLPRQELLKTLQRMDFLVNFENVGSKQTPSKQIDYLILDKPVLSIKTGHLNIKVLMEFLTGNYQGKFVIDQPDQYRIENVTSKFLNLLTDD